MSINWDTVLTIGVTQIVSTTFTYYTLKFHESLGKNGKRHSHKEQADSTKSPEAK